MIEVTRAELGTLDVQALARPVTAEWTPVTPAMRRFEALLAAETIEQCRSLAELPVGTAVVTPSSGLPAELLIHIVVRSDTEPVTRGGVARGLRSALLRAEEWGGASLAMPPLGTGAGNLDGEEAAEVMVPILSEWHRGGHAPARIVIAVESDYEQEVFERKIQTELAGDGTPDLPLLDPL